MYLTTQCLFCNKLINVNKNKNKGVLRNSLNSLKHGEISHSLCNKLFWEYQSQLSQILKYFPDSLQKNLTILIFKNIPGKEIIRTRFYNLKKILT